MSKIFNFRNKLLPNVITIAGVFAMMQYTTPKYDLTTFENIFLTAGAILITTLTVNFNWRGEK